jgi:hypothetical protein
LVSVSEENAQSFAQPIDPSAILISLQREFLLTFSAFTTLAPDDADERFTGLVSICVRRDSSPFSPNHTEHTLLRSFVVDIADLHFQLDEGAATVAL